MGGPLGLFWYKFSTYLPFSYQSCHVMARLWWHHGIYLRPQGNAFTAVKNRLYNTLPWWYIFQASVGAIRTTIGYLYYETNLVGSAEFKIRLPVALVLCFLLCLVIFIAYRSVNFLHNKWRVFQQRTHFERKFNIYIYIYIYVYIYTYIYICCC